MQKCTDEDIAVFDDHLDEFFTSGKISETVIDKLKNSACSEDAYIRIINVYSKKIEGLKDDLDEVELKKLKKLYTKLLEIFQNRGGRKTKSSRRRVKKTKRNKRSTKRARK